MVCETPRNSQKFCFSFSCSSVWQLYILCTEHTLRQRAHTCLLFRVVCEQIQIQLWVQFEHVCVLNCILLPYSAADSRHITIAKHNSVRLVTEAQSSPLHLWGQESIAVNNFRRGTPLLSFCRALVSTSCKTAITELRWAALKFLEELDYRWANDSLKTHRTEWRARQPNRLQSTDLHQTQTFLERTWPSTSGILLALKTAEGAHAKTTCASKHGSHRLQVNTVIRTSCTLVLQYFCALHVQPDKGYSACAWLPSAPTIDSLCFAQVNTFNTGVLQACILWVARGHAHHLLGMTSRRIHFCVFSTHSHWETKNKTWIFPRTGFSIQGLSLHPVRDTAPRGGLLFLGGNESIHMLRVATLRKLHCLIG